MTKRKKIILIGVAVTLALVLGVGGLIYANNDHTETGGHKLIGVGEMGERYYDGDWYQHQEWDTNFIVTNPNCEKDLKIEWVALIAGEDIWSAHAPFIVYDAEEVIFEGTPDDWYDEYSIKIPGNDNSERGVLSQHEVWQVSIDEILEEDPADLALGKYTLEVTWSGASYSWWLGWGRVRPLIGWQKEKCWSWFENWWEEGLAAYVDFPAFSISEAEMQLFPSRIGFKLPRPPVP